MSYHVQEEGEYQMNYLNIYKIKQTISIFTSWGNILILNSERE